MVKRIASVLIIVSVLFTGLLSGCGACRHDYEERDGRVVCLKCKDVCDHDYEVDGSEAYCKNCLFSCKHNFEEKNGDMVCDSCSIVCKHEFDNGVCKLCKKECNHEYETIGTEVRCKICNGKCRHDFEESNGNMICKICNETCAHKFGNVNGSYRCESCGILCEHDFKENSGKLVCQKCGFSKVMLTLDNVNDYFTVNVRVYDVFVERDSIGTNDIGEGKADITILSKQDVKYKNVVLTVRLVSSHEEWINRVTDVEISYDGNGHKTISYLSKYDSYVPANPGYKTEIVGVKGEIDA